MKITKCVALQNTVSPAPSHFVRRTYRYYPQQCVFRYFFLIEAIPLCYLTLNLPTTTIVAQPFNVIKWQLKFNPVA
jgi:hypothetical protein